MDAAWTSFSRWAERNSTALLLMGACMGLLVLACWSGAN